MSEARLEAEGQIDFAKIDATTDDDIRRQMIEDGEDPDAPFDGFVLKGGVSPAAIRQRLGMSQGRFAEALTIPVKTLRNWEQGRSVPDPAAQALLRLVSGDPDHAFKILGALRYLDSEPEPKRA